MPRAAPTEEPDPVESIVVSHPCSMGISAVGAEIARRGGDKSTRRTLRRCLQHLIGGQRLTTEGESIALDCNLISGIAMLASASIPVATAAPAEAGLYVPALSNGATVRDQVPRPLTQR